MNPQHFGSDPADIRIRIKINPEIQIRIPDHFQLTFGPWLSLRSLGVLLFIIIIIFYYYSYCSTNLSERLNRMRWVTGVMLRRLEQIWHRLHWSNGKTSPVITTMPRQTASSAHFHSAFVFITHVA